jgi:hypothetical protein
MTLEGLCYLFYRKVSRTQLNMQSGYAALTIGVDRLRKKEGLVQAHPVSRRMHRQSDTRMVVDNVT